MVSVSTMTSALLNAASTSPKTNSNSFATFEAGVLSSSSIKPPGRRAGLLIVPSLSCSIGAPSFMASSEVLTCGNTSYSTSINLDASSARCAESAAIAAMACPLYKAFSLAMTFCPQNPILTIAPSGISDTLPGSIGRSYPVMTACTPGIAIAFEASIEIIRA